MSGDNGASAGKVTLREFLELRFDTIEKKIDDICERDKARVKEIDDKLQEHERRLVKLERVVWLLGGIFALLTPVSVWAIIEIIKMLSR